MSLGELLAYIGRHPEYVLYYFIFLMLVVYLLGIFGRSKGHTAPYKYIYAALIYLICVPGIFSVALLAYLFLFERKSIYEVDLIAQVLPIVVMVVSIFQIRRNVNLDDIPGFDKLSGLVLIIVFALGLMWIIDRLRLVAFSFIPFQYVLLVFAGLLVGLRFAIKRFSS